MLRQLAAALGLVALSACAGNQGAQLDLYKGTWGTEGIRPPPGLVRAEASPLIGRSVTVDDGASLPIQAVLVDGSGRERYVVVPDTPFAGGIVVPITALAVSPTDIALNGGRADLRWLQHHSPADMDRLYRPTAGLPADQQPLAGSPIPLPVATIPFVSPVPESLVLLHNSSVVGMPVVDSTGASIGAIDSVAAVPGTGQVLYVLIAGPGFGDGGYVLVSAASVKLAGERIQLPGSTAAALEGLHHYRPEDRPELTGAVIMN